MNTDRVRALHSLVKYELPVDRALAQLSSFGWDAPEPLVWLTSADVENLLARYASGELTAEQVTDWADLIECREDIGVSNEEAYLNGIVFRLANPNLNEEITPQVVGRMQKEIQRARGAA
jgi:hypothetical protein